VAIYVDDILILSDKQDLTDGLIYHLASRLVKVKYEKAEEFTFLGVKITRDRHGRTISPSQPIYVESILGQELDVGMLPSRFPLKEQNVMIASLEETVSMSLKDRESIFTRVVGKLRYLADRTRLDLQYTLSRLASIMTSPSNESYVELQRTLRYLKGTKELRLTVGGDTPIFLFAMTDASFGIIMIIGHIKDVRYTLEPELNVSKPQVKELQEYLYLRCRWSQRA
jgi:hypothetical protein